MPRGDRTGPVGQGSRTGRGLGNCAGADWQDAGQYGRRFGGRRGRRLWARATGFPRWMRFGGNSPAPMDEASLLQTEAEQLQTQLDTVQKRLAELDND